MSEAFRDQPEFFEVDLGESLLSRTETLASFRELGPPDLCHVIKSTGRPGSRDIGSYHYVSGVDASSSAALAAYLNSLTYELEDNSNWFSGKTTWKVRSGAYCCFNAFSRVDVRVEVRIPGGVDAYVVDLRGERHEATPEMWQEAYLSALLRAILYSDDANYRLAGFRKLDPITTLEAEQRFIQTAEALFFKGWQLGSDPEIQVATVVSNHMTAGILKYFGDSNRWDQAVNLFEKLYAREPEVATLVAKSYLGMNEELKAVHIMNQALRENPMSYSLLHVQCDFLRSKGKSEWALKLAKQAVNCAPSEFVTWAKLTEIHIDLGNWELALLTLNSCPMFTYNERDLHRMPTPARSHLPVKQFISESGILDEDSARDNEADIALLRLPAPSLRGTFAKAYALLTLLVSKIGWDELLKARSNVFVMEEEYRMQKATEDPKGRVNGASATVETTAVPATEAPDGKADSAQEGADDDASTKALRESAETPKSPPAQPNTPGTGRLNMEELDIPRPSSAQSIPTIKISSESDRERETLTLDANGSAFDGDAEVDNADAEQNGQVAEAMGEEGTDEEATPTPMEQPSLERPQQAANDGEGGEDGGASGSGMAPSSNEPQQPPLSFADKRLCERWLDNLFMVLYEDLRVYTIWRAEVAHYKQQQLPYRKTGTEWEILGDLACRLQHKEEGKDAYQRCLETKFSAKAWLKLLEIFANERDVQRTLSAAVRMTTYHHRWYMEAAYPSAVATQLFKLVRSEGLAKVSYTLVAMAPPQPILRLMQTYFNYAQAFRVPGYDF